MKKLFIATLLLLGITLVGFKTLSNHHVATVDSEQGLMLFVKSKPVDEYEFLGTVKTGAVIPNYKFETILDILLKRTKKDYPNADAIIMRDFEADAIKFKD